MRINVALILLLIAANIMKYPTWGTVWALANGLALGCEFGAFLMMRIARQADEDADAAP